jgi:plasmid maintenance system killer protein
METDPGYHGGLPAAVVTAFRKRMQTIRAAPNEHVLHALKSLHFEQLKEELCHQYSMRFNEQSAAIGILNDSHDTDHRYAMPLTDQRNARGSVESNDSRVTHSTTPFSP